MLTLTVPFLVSVDGAAAVTSVCCVIYTDLFYVTGDNCFACIAGRSVSVYKHLKMSYRSEMCHCCYHNVKRLYNTICSIHAAIRMRAHPQSLLKYSLRVGPVPGIGLAGPTLLRFGPGTFFGPDSVHAQHLLMICSVGHSVILPVASDKRPVLVSHDGW